MDAGRTRRLVGSVVLVVALAALVGAPGVASAKGQPPPPPPPGASSWRLVDNAQTGCFSARVHDTYFGIWIEGRWTSAIDVGASGLPAGGAFDTSYAPIAPGSSTGIYSLAYVHVSLATNPPIGTYSASLWASDGATTQQVPVTIDVRARCGNY
jgi:hypothetical protein